MNISCIVDVASREVSFQENYRIAAYDHNVDVIHFSVEPIEDFSLDLSSIKIAAQGPNKARHDYSVDPSTVQIEEETGYITFDWPIPAGVTEMPIGTFKYGDKGNLIFAVCAEIISGDTVSKAWHSDDGIITVVAHLEPESGGGEDPEEEATNAQKIGQLQTDVAVINTQIGALANGSPTPVATVAEMTDESAVYLYTGSETGYTAGNWYYYNGSAWTSGGTYGGATTSTTFNQHGVPADDFAVGEALADKADADDLTALETVVAGKADSADLNVINNKIDAVIDAETVTTWETCDKDDERFTQIGGYISASGVISSPSSDIHKIWYFVPEHDINVYVTRLTTTGQLRLGVYNDENIARDNINQYGTTGSGVAQYPLPTEEEPFHALAGQCVAVSIYNSSIYDWVLHVGTESTTGALKQTIGLTDQMETEVDAKVSSVQSEVDVHDLLINTFHDLINYGYDTEESRDPVPSATDSTVLGYHRKKYVVTLNGGGSTHHIVVKLNGNIQTTTSDETVRTFEATVPLEEDRTYRFAAQMISGELSTTGTADYVALSVYASGQSRSAGSYTISADRKKFVREVAGNGGFYNVCLYLASGITLTNAVFLVYMEDVTGEQEESGGSIETYFLQEMEDTVSKVRDSADAPALVFPLVTDIHRYSSASQTFEKMIANMRKFTKEVKCDFIVNMGDTIEGNAQQETSLEYAYDSSADFCNIGIPYFFANGNHDNNPYISSATLKFNIKQTFKAFYAGVKGVTYNIAENGTDYFIDFENLEVRIISLNSCNVNVSATYGFGTSTASWLASALDTEFTVIAIMHVSPIPEQVWNNNSPTNNTSIKNALQNFVDGGGKLILFAGHSHVDATFIDPWVSIMQVCQKFEQADITTEAYGKMSGYIDVLGNPARTSETYTEDAWSVCVYKPFDEELDMIRFGAGADRYIHLTPIAPSTVTSMLDNVTWSSSDTSVATVSSGTVTEVGTGRCAIIAKDSAGNIEVWIVEVTA